MVTDTNVHMIKMYRGMQVMLCPYACAASCCSIAVEQPCMAPILILTHGDEAHNLCT